MSEDRYHGYPHFIDYLKYQFRPKLIPNRFSQNHHKIVYNSQADPHGYSYSTLKQLGFNVLKQGYVNNLIYDFNLINKPNLKIFPYEDQLIWFTGSGNYEVCSVIEFSLYATQKRSSAYFNTVPSPYNTKYMYQYNENVHRKNRRSEYHPGYTLPSFQHDIWFDKKDWDFNYTVTVKFVGVNAMNTKQVTYWQTDSNGRVFAAGPQKKRPRTGRFYDRKLKSYTNKEMYQLLYKYKNENPTLSDFAFQYKFQNNQWYTNTALPGEIPVNDYEWIPTSPRWEELRKVLKHADVLNNRSEHSYKYTSYRGKGGVSSLTYNQKYILFGKRNFISQSSSFAW